MTTAETDIDNVEQDLTTHENRQDNPHTVTKTQVGLSDVNNTSDLNKPISTATQTALDLKADLVEGKVPANQLPSYVDDVLEVYVRTAATPLNSDFFSLTSVTGTALTPESGKIYLVIGAVDTDLVNTTYRWGGTHYAVIGDIALGTTAATAFPGDRGLALETLTDNIVDGDQALALKNQVIRNTVVGTSPLVVNSIASTTANLTEFQVNGTKVLEVNKDGWLFKNGARFIHNNGDGNTFIGINSGSTSITGIWNTGIGSGALASLTTQQQNVGIGILAGNASTGGANTFLGSFSGGGINITGGLNTFIGVLSGNNVSQLTTASNSTAIGNASFTDKSNQMVFGNASVSEFKFDRNTSATLLVPQITSSFSGGNSTFNRGTTALTNESASALEIKHTTSADMVDGFGARQLFTIRDSANVDNTIARLGSVRSGADNSGRFVFETANAGTTTEKMTILPNGNVGIGTASPARLLSLVTSSNDDGIQIRRNSSDTNAYATLGFRIVGGGENAFNTSEIRGVLTNRTSFADTDLTFLTFTGGGSLTEKMRIRNDGNVGIGTNSPSAKLDVSGGTGDNGISINSTTSGNPFIDFKTDGVAKTNIYFDRVNNLFRINSSTINTTINHNGGNVGIGTSSPAGKLDIYGSKTTSYSGTSVVNDFFRIFNVHNSGGTNQESTLALWVSGNNGANNGVVQLSAVAPTNGVSSADFVVRTRNVGDYAERMRILANGNVGIGTSAPTHIFNVVSGANADGIQIRRNSTSSNDYAVLGFRINTSENSANFAELRAIRTNRAVNADTDLAFHTFSNSTLAERMRIRDDGLVGINETTLSAQLTVKSGATDRVPLIVDTIASHATDIVSFRINGSAQSRILTNGSYVNGAGANNSQFSPTNDGAVILRNIADSNPALIVNQVHASSTGNITQFQWQGTTQASIARNGIANFTGTPSNEQTANYTLVLADKGKVLRINSDSDRIVTIPLNSSVAFPIDTEIAILRYGTGTVDIAATAGVNLYSKNSEKSISGRYGSVALKKIAENDWVLVGSLEA
jgi:hypothetical protein